MKIQRRHNALRKTRLQRELGVIPKGWKRREIKIGDSAKIYYRGEYFWCTIDEELPNNEYSVTVDNHLCTNQIQCGDRLTIRPNNIYFTWSNDKDRFIKMFEKVQTNVIPMATKSIMAMK